MERIHDSGIDSSRIDERSLPIEVRQIYWVGNDLLVMPTGEDAMVSVSGVKFDGDIMEVAGARGGMASRSLAGDTAGFGVVGVAGGRIVGGGN